MFKAMTRPGPLAPVIGLDIDGTSGDYHAHFIVFAEAWIGRELPSATEYTGGVPFHRYLGISRATYNKVKLAYRQGGLKRSMPVYEGIGDFTRQVRRQGVQVWICTTRPYLRLDNIDPDTRHWVKDRAKMQYDAVLYGEHKYRDLAKAVGAERVLMVYDDLPRMIEQAMSVGLPACLRTQPYNVYWGPPEGSGSVPAVSSVAGMREVFYNSLYSWRRDNG